MPTMATAIEVSAPEARMAAREKILSMAREHEAKLSPSEFVSWTVKESDLDPAVVRSILWQLLSEAKLALSTSRKITVPHRKR